jgi:hypothetical protein
MSWSNEVIGLKTSVVCPPIDFVTANRVDQPTVASHGTSDEPVAITLIESTAGRCPGPGVAPYENGPSSGSFTSGTAVCSAPETTLVGVMAISHQWPVVTKAVV